MRPRNEEIFVKILRNGMIPQLGICGPIPNPIKITRGQAHSMIVAGIDVYQYFPKTKYTSKLTLQNVFEDSEEKKTSNNNKPTEQKISEPIHPVNLGGVQKVVTPSVNTDENDDVTDIKSTESGNTSVNTDKSENDITEDSSNNNTQQRNNNYNKNRNKKHR